eukprot:2594574-Rhodomonas_salina.1
MALVDKRLDVDSSAAAAAALSSCPTLSRARFASRPLASLHFPRPPPLPACSASAAACCARRCMPRCSSHCTTALSTSHTQHAALLFALPSPVPSRTRQRQRLALPTASTEAARSLARAHLPSAQVELSPRLATPQQSSRLASLQVAVQRMLSLFDNKDAPAPCTRQHACQTLRSLRTNGKHFPFRPRRVSAAHAPSNSASPSNSSAPSWLERGSN